MTWTAFALLVALLPLACSSSDGATDASLLEAGAETVPAADGRPPGDVGSLDAATPDGAVDAPALADAAADAALDQAPSVDASQPDRPAPDAAPPDAGSPDATPPDVAGPDAVALCGRIRCDCTLDGIKLTGKVKYVDAVGFPDFKVRVVNSALADLFVQEVVFPPDPQRCGQWQVDEFFPDFKVQKVGDFDIADFEIQYVDFQPGLPGHR
jgi:hypothetical protein